MGCVRPTKLLTAAGVVGVLAVLLTWAADPAWARAAAVDVWNFDRLEGELRQQQAEAARLTALGAALEDQYAVNRLLIGDVFDGRRPLAEAAAAYWRANRDRPGFAHVVQLHFAGPTPEAKAAHNLLSRIAYADDLPADRKPRELARLRAEYAAAFGVPVD